MTTESGDRIPGRSLARKSLLAVIKGYRRFISPLLPSSCIYTPTCSMYAETAVERFGVLKGSWLAIRRILRCHPFRAGGFDPVPDKWENRNLASGGMRSGHDEEEDV
ncbi:MAG: membrane protein insertion efficiency factor YidD [Candidatus Fermentibacteraceae bacterium]|nr:membrane protein insertion efficiency factor YidD [Candidatus Fermentibacteraceae bacterium]MBN2609641.1 membrane protein insertion efficiency factor YidD [Candidatus Fermentibacteraceae bacterium]